MSISIRKATDFGQQKVSICLIGSAGVGKTSLLGTTKKRVLLLDTDKGTMSLRKAKNVDIIEASTFDEVQEFCKFITTEECKKEYDIIAVDSASIVSKMCFKWAKQTIKNKFDVYPSYGDKLESFLKFIRDSGYHTVNIFETTFETDALGERIFVPATDWAKFSCRVSHIYDEVFAMREIDKKRVIQTGVESGFACKDRSKNLEKFEEPNLDIILNKILETKEK